MKKLTGILIALAVAMSFTFAEAKEAPCQKTCAGTFVKCKKDAKGDKVKIAACETAKKDCMGQCEKEAKEKEDKAKEEKKAKKEKKVKEEKVKEEKVKEEKAK